MKDPISNGRWIALQDAMSWRPLKGLVSAIAKQFGIEEEAVGTMLYEGMSAGRIAHRIEGPDARNWIVTQKAAEWAKDSGLKYNEHIDWGDGTLNRPGGRSYPLEVYLPDVERLARQPSNVIGPPRGRGRVPVARQSAIKAMLRDLRSGKQTPQSLTTLKQEALAAEYGVRSRDTAIKARSEAISAFAGKAGN